MNVKHPIILPRNVAVRCDATETFASWYLVCIKRGHLPFSRQSVGRCTGTLNLLI